MNLSGKETLDNLFELLDTDFAGLAKAIGFREGRVRAWYSRPRISLDGVFALSNTFGFSSEWLLFGRGPVFHEGVKNDLAVQKLSLQKAIEDFHKAQGLESNITIVIGGDSECLREAA